LTFQITKQDPTTNNNDSNDDIIVANTHQQTLEWKYSTVWTSSFFEAHTLLHNTIPTTLTRQQQQQQHKTSRIVEMKAGTHVVALNFRPLRC